MDNKLNIKRLIQESWDVIEDLVSIIIAAAILFWGWFVDNEIFENDLLLWSSVIAILTIMAIGNLRDRRHRFRTIQTTVEETLKEIRGNKIYDIAGADHFFKGKQEEIQDKLISASSIDIVGITLSTSVGSLSELLKDRLKENAKVRIIILDSNSDDALLQLVKRSWSKKATREKYIAMLENASDLLGEVGSEPNLTGSFEIGYLPLISSVGIILINANQDDGVGHIKVFHQLKREVPSFCINARDDPETFAFYQEQFELMWSECKVNKVKKVV